MLSIPIVEAAQKFTTKLPDSADLSFAVDARGYQIEQLDNLSTASKRQGRYPADQN